MSPGQSDSALTDAISPSITAEEEKLYQLLPPIPENMRFNGINLHQLAPFVELTLHGRDLTNLVEGNRWLSQIQSTKLGEPEKPLYLRG